MKILTVARWYPSYDAPGRGSFVADLVRATFEVGVDARVVSFDRVLVTGPAHKRERARAKARAAYDEIATPERLFVAARSLGAPGVPVARIPLVRRAGSGDVAALLEDHRDALRPFVELLTACWRPDVIHAHTGLPDGIVSAAIGRELGIPVVVTEHASTIETDLANPDVLGPYRGLLEPDVRLLAVSPPTAQRLASLLGVEPHRVGVIANPIFDEEFPMADPAGRHANELLYAGSLGAHKEIDVLLHAHALLRAERPGLRLRLIGPERQAGDRMRWEALAKSLGIADDLDFDGWADREHIAAAMARASVLVHPSPSETFGVVAAEAIFSGLPVASRRSGGVPWIIGLSGGYGAVADGDDPAAFARAIGTALDRSFGVDAATARAGLVATVGAGAVARETLRVYRGVAGGVVAGGGVAQPIADRPLPVPTVLAATYLANAMRLVPALPAGLRSTLVLVVPHSRPSSPPDSSPNAVPPVRIVEASPVPPRQPPERARGARRLFRRAPPPRQPTAGDMLGAAVLAAAAAAQVGSDPVEVVALDGPAAALIAGLDASRVRLAPGALGLLVDRWDVADQHRST